MPVPGPLSALPPLRSPRLPPPLPSCIWLSGSARDLGCRLAREFLHKPTLSATSAPHLATSLKEPSWHVRARRGRAEARHLLRAWKGQRTPRLAARLDAAARLLDGHHGSSSGMAPRADAEWLCKTCLNKRGEPFSNRAENKNCHKCKVAKGKCYWKPAYTGPPSRSVRPSGGTTAPTKEVTALQKKVAAMEKQLREAQAAAQTKEAGGGDESMEEEDVEDLRREELKLVEDNKKLDAIDGTEALVAKNKARIKEIQAKRLSAKPLGSQWQILEERVNKVQKGIDKRSMRDKECESKIKELQEERAGIAQENLRAKQQISEYRQQQQVIARNTRPEVDATGRRSAAEVAQVLLDAYSAVGALAAEHDGVSQLKKFMPNAQELVDMVKATEIKEARAAAATAAAEEAAGGLGLPAARPGLPGGPPQQPAGGGAPPGEHGGGHGAGSLAPSMCGSIAPAFGDLPEHDQMEFCQDFADLEEPPPDGEEEEQRTKRRKHHEPKAKAHFELTRRHVRKAIGKGAPSRTAGG